MKAALRWLASFLAIFCFSLVQANAAETITYQYDALGRLVAVQSSGTVNDGQSVTTTFDAAGNRTNYKVENAALPTVSIGNASATEGGTLTFTVTLSKMWGDAVSVAYASANVSAVQPGDYGVVNNTLTFSPGDISKAITVTTVDDSAVESAETMTVTLSSPSGATLGAATGTGTINDNDLATANLAIGAASVTEGGTLSFTVTRSGNTGIAASASYVSASGTATSGSDFTAASGTVSFAAGETSKTITVATTDDAAVESAETLTVTLSGPSADTTITTPTGTGTINDNDSGSADLAIGAASVTEGGSLSFTVTRSGNTGIAASASYASASGTATSGSDFTAASGTVSFGAGETTKTIMVATTDDAAVESAETLTVTLSGPSANTTITSATGTGTINDNDVGPAQLAISDASVTEGATLVFTVTRSGDLTQTSTANYITNDGTAQGSTDFGDANGTVSFAPGETSKTINITTVDDATVESTENVTVVLSAATNATLSDATGTGTIADNDVATSWYAVGNASTTEGGTLAYTVTRSGDTSGSVSVYWQTSGGTATEADVAGPFSGTLTFASGQTTANIGILTIDDAAQEPTKTLLVHLPVPPPGAVITAAGTGSIQDNDTPATLAVGNATATEGQPLLFTITRSGDTSVAVSATYTFAAGSASVNDFGGGWGTVNFAPGETSQIIGAGTVDDSLVESSETITLTLSAPMGGATITTAVGTGTINDNDTSLAWTGGAPSTAEGGTLTFTVTRAGITSGVSSVDFATSNSTATASSDYTAASGTLTFLAGETTKTISVVTIDDSIVESSVENLALTLSNPLGATITTGTVYGLINDNDVATATLAIGAAGVTEGGTLSFTVTRSGNTGIAASASYASASGTATSGSDFTAASGTVSFAAGETSKTISVTTTEDAVVESAETLTVTLSGPSANTTITTATGTGTINDNDVAAANLAIGAASVTEGGTLSFTVTRSGNTGIAASASYASASGTATSGSDFTAASGTVSFAAGETSKTISVTTTEDAVVESAETLTVTLSGPSANTTITTATGTGTINDNDVAAANLAIGAASVSEGGTLSFTVTRSGNTTTAASASYASASGTATSGNDFTAASGTVSFAAGETSKTIGVTTTDDAVVESAETLTVTLSGPSANTTITTAVGTGTINDNDVAAANLAIGAASVTEGGTLSFTVTRSGNTTTAASASYASASGTATSGSDFTAASGTVSFAIGETSKTISVTTTDDAVVESAETLTVTLSGPSANTTITTATGTGTINDNDVASATLAIGAASVTEGGTLSFTVTRSGNTGIAASASYASASGTATSGSDFTAVSGTVSLAAGETSKTIIVATTDDAAVESAETLTVTLSGPSANTTITTAAGTGTINDNDGSPANVAINPSSTTEGGNLSFYVGRTGNTSTAVSVSYTSSPGTATAGSDYTSVSGTLNFAAGQTYLYITVPTTDDSAVESSETMTITLSNPTSGATITTATNTGTINDNDGTPLVRINPASATEGGNMSFYVGRTNGTTGAISVDYTSSPGTATAGSDYTAVSGTLNFAAGQTYLYITVPTTDDSTVESSETMTITLSNPTGGATITTATNTGTINDNDGTPLVRINPASATEGGNMSFYVGRTNGTTGAISVDYTSSPGTATAGSDYTAVSGTLNFAAGQTYLYITVPTINDSTVESSETMTITLSNPTGGATITTATNTGTINDND